VQTARAIPAWNVLGEAFMPLNITMGYQQLVSSAEKDIETISIEDALALHGDDNVVFVDLRDVRELWREGYIPGAFHCPRGMLEFWIDPGCIYYKDIFACGKKFIFYCNLGWRSALAAQVSQQMGLSPVAHIAGGLDAWVKAGGPVANKERKK
jgi:rhodanese-related sulfurtransferase